MLLLTLVSAGRGESSCDLNLDGQVNVVDVQNGVNQSLGIEPCSSADVNSDGNCNVVDVQTVINGALGSPCPTQVTEGPGVSKPWVTGFTPKRIHYVDDIGCGGSGTIGSPECLSNATSHYQCGDLHILRTGAYLQTFDYHTEFSRDCTSGSPAVWKAFVSSTGQPENAQFRPVIQTPGAWNWFVNIHIDGEEAVHTPSLMGIKVEDPGNKVINSVVHDTSGSLLQWFSKDTDVATPGMVAYGNVLYGAGPGTNGAHNVYTQNDCHISGLKYFVHNISVEPRTEDGGRQVFLANDSLGEQLVCGYWLEKNFFAGGPTKLSNTVIWTSTSSLAQPAPDINLINNYFVDMYHSTSLYEGVRMGYHVPVQLEATGNYFARANMALVGYWGNSGTHDPNVFTGNEIYDPPNGAHVVIVTDGEAGSEGSHKFNNADVWDNNTYGGTFKAIELHCNGVKTTNLTLAQWRTATKACRATPASAVGFDINSTTRATPTVNKIEVVPNQYQCPSGCPFTDSAWGNIYLVNWENAASDIVNISSVVGAGKQYVVRYPRDFWGTPAASGTCPASGACNVSLPTRRSSGAPSGNFANAYVITGQP